MGAISMSEPILEARKLTFVRSRQIVLRDVDLTVGAGELVALLGSNGAGKTTLLRCLAGALCPVAGEVLCSGVAPARSPLARRRIGFLGHESGLYFALTARENLLFAGRLYGVEDVSDRVGELLSAVGLQQQAHQRAGCLSRGMRQRLAIARAVIHDPPILLLDEPFTSLDPPGRDWLKSFLCTLRQRDRAILIVSHDAEQAQSWADRLLCLRAGRVHQSFDCGLRIAEGSAVRRPAPQPAACTPPVIRNSQFAIRNPVIRNPQSAIRNRGTFLWLVVKDLVTEFRVRRAWPAMLLLGLVLVLLVEIQADLPIREKLQVVSGLLWLNIFFAGTLAVDRSFASEREEGCWRALLLYPLSPSVLFLAKMAVSFLALGLLECFLIPAFVVFSNAPLLDRPLPLLLIACLGNLGFASVGALVSGLTTTFSQRGSLLALLVLPLMTPVILGAAEATRLLVLGDLGERWCGWMQLLAAFAVLFTTLGTLVFPFALED
jgi:heme exporter protein A